MANILETRSLPTQRLLVWRHLKQSPLMAKEAEKAYGIKNLGGRVSELRQAGFPIVTKYVKRAGKRTARYFLP